MNWVRKSILPLPVISKPSPVLSTSAIPTQALSPSKHKKNSLNRSTEGVIFVYHYWGCTSIYRPFEI